jgi:RNA-directed DNA polymerase
MNDGGKSDKPIVPKKPANEGRAQARLEEPGEGRGLAKGNPGEQTRFWTQGQIDLSHALDRIRKAAKEDKARRFTALWHHVYNITRLREAYRALKREAAPGVDGQTWQAYGEALEENLKDLSARLARGTYRAQPVKRVYIPKGDGRLRPIGITALEDKIVQRAATQVLNAVYEVDFQGFSYGFRPGRSQHDALDAVTVGIETRKISWVLDADIQGFFDTMDHEWVLRFVEHRIGDRRVLRHIQKWLKAGVLEDGAWREEREGVPQGGSISPLLANIYLHYTLDLWAEQWRRKHARGEVILVRYADDFVVGFQHQDDANRFHEELHVRLEKFHLKLSTEKTRLIAFGRYAEARRAQRGEGKPETFNLGGASLLPLSGGVCAFLVGFPHGVPPLGLDVGAQVEDVLAALDAPTHAALTQARLDEGLARCLDRAAADGQPLAAEIGIGHVALVAHEVVALRVQLLAPRRGQRMRARVVLHGAQQRVHGAVLLQQLRCIRAEPFPGLLRPFAEQGLCRERQVLGGVVIVEDEHAGRKQGRVVDVLPQGARPVAQDDFDNVGGRVFLSRLHLRLEFAFEGGRVGLGHLGGIDVGKARRRGVLLRVRDRPIERHHPHHGVAVGRIVRLVSLRLGRSAGRPRLAAPASRMRTLAPSRLIASVRLPLGAASCSCRRLRSASCPSRTRWATSAPICLICVA